MEVLLSLVHSPKLPMSLRELKAIYQEEDCRRQEFYDTIGEQQKVEFINGGNCDAVTSEAPA